MKTWQEATFSQWSVLLPPDNKYHCLPDTNAPEFLEAVAAFGNLTLIETWERAFVAFTAKFLAELCAHDPQFLIECHLLALPRSEGWTHLVTAVIEQLLTMPKASQALGDGWSVFREYGCLLRRTDPTEVEALLQPFAAALRPNLQHPNSASGDSDGQ
jgi:hypothetical protein